MAAPSGYYGWLASQKRPTGYYGWLETQEKKHKKHPPAWSTETRPQPQNAPTQQITLTGYDYDNQANNRTLTTLAGDSAPTIVSGNVPNISIIARPQRRSLTQFTGYDPPSMQISLRFMQFDLQYGWLTNDDAGAANETDIKALEWMGGHGLDHGVAPIVYATTRDRSANTIPLIPFDWQIADTPDVPKAFHNTFTRPWMIQTLAMDQDPIRNPNGFRIKQDATVTLIEYENISAAGSGSAALRNQTAKGKATIFRATVAENTPLKIARSPAIHALDPQKTALAIKNSPANKKLHLHGAYSRIKPGTVVHVPAGS